MLWSAPECLRAVTSERFVDRQKVDIYALGVVLKEVFTRSGPYTEYPFLVPHGETTYLSPHVSQVELLLNINFIYCGHSMVILNSNEIFGHV